MLAYALAGTSRVTGAPPAKDEEVTGADITQFGAPGHPYEVLRQGQASDHAAATGEKAGLAAEQGHRREVGMGLQVSR